MSLDNAEQMADQHPRFAFKLKGGFTTTFTLNYLTTPTLLLLFANPLFGQHRTSENLVSKRNLNETRTELQSAILKTIDSTTVAAQVSGLIQSLDIREGAQVKTNQHLGKVKDDAVLLELSQLETQVRLAQKKHKNDINERLAAKALEVARNEYERALGANKLVPNTYPLNEIDRLRLVADKAALEVERAQHDQEIAKFDVDLKISDYRRTRELQQRHQIAAPVPGVVVSVEKRAGEWVEPGTALLKIVRTDQLRVEGFLPAEAAQPGLVGRSAHVEAGRGDSIETFDAKVVFVSPDVNPVNKQARVFLEVTNREGMLRPGLRVNAFVDMSQ